LKDQIVQQALQDNDNDDEAEDIDPYTGEAVDEEVPPVAPAAPAPEAEELDRRMERIFEQALAAFRGDDGERRSSFETRANRDVIATALLHFIRRRIPAALEDGPRLVALDPLFALQYSLYLRFLPEDGTGLATAHRVRAVVEGFRGHVPPWTQAWLLNALLRADATLDDETTDLARSFMSSDAPSVVRSRAALVLALHQQLAPKELGRLYEDATDAARADLVVAAAMLAGDGNPPPEVEALIDGSPFQRLVFEYARERLPNLQWL
jgi:hypothetical protein